MDEIELIKRILRGHTEGFGILVQRYMRMCLSLAYRITKDDDAAQDVVQDAMISAYEHIKGFKSDSKFSTWLYRIVLNQALSSNKKQRYFEDTDQVQTLDEDHELEIVEAQGSGLQEALSSLPDKERLIIDLFYYQDQSIKEIAAICHITEANVKVIMHRARKKMNQILSQKSVNLSQK